VQQQLADQFRNDRRLRELAAAGWALIMVLHAGGSTRDLALRDSTMIQRVASLRDLTECCPSFRVSANRGKEVVRR
jgi:hypothetical protein